MRRKAREFLKNFLKNRKNFSLFQKLSFFYIKKGKALAFSIGLVYNNKDAK